MNGWQSFFDSRTVRALLVVVGVALGSLGVQFTEDDQAKTSELVVSIVSAVGGLAAIVYRVKATKQIGS